MKKHYNININDIISRQVSAPNYNNELIIIEMGGYSMVDSGEQIQIDAFSVLIMTAGTLDITLNGNDYHICAPAFLDVLDIHTVEKIYRSSDYKGYGIIMSHYFIAEVMRGIQRLSVANFLDRYNNPIMQITQTEMGLLEGIVSKLKENIGRYDHIFQRDIIKIELRSLLLEISNIVAQKQSTTQTYNSVSKEDIVAHFVHLINKHCTTEHSVGFYAKELCVESKYLSRILKVSTGKTANSWINDAIMIQAKILLKDPELNIQHIADHLHFSDQSSFGKFFKKNTSITPIDYRRRLYL